MLDTTIKVKTDYFDGPLGLLLLLIQKEEMDVRDLNLTKITKQYLDYLAQMRELNFDVAGDYLYLASTLLLLKSKDCISEEESNRLKEQIEGASELNFASQSELIRRLEELQHFQAMSHKLWDLDKKGHTIFTKPRVNRKAIVNSILTPISIEKLTEAMMDFLHKEKRKYTVIRRDRLSIKEKLAFLKENLSLGSESTLQYLIDSHGEPGTDNTVITFISLLELARLKRIEVFQNETMGEIYINVVKPLDDFDVNQADGFEEETAGGDFDPIAAAKEEELTEVVEQAIEEAEVFTSAIENEESMDDETVIEEAVEETIQENKDQVDTDPNKLKNIDLETPKLMQ